MLVAMWKEDISFLKSSVPFPSFAISLSPSHRSFLAVAGLKSNRFNVDSQLQSCLESAGMLPPACCCVTDCGTNCKTRPKPPWHTHTHTNTDTQARKHINLDTYSFNANYAISPYALFSSAFIFCSHTVTPKQPFAFSLDIMHEPWPIYAISLLHFYITFLKLQTEWEAHKA